MDTNYQEQHGIYDIMAELTACGAGKEIIQMAKDDLDFGIDGGTVLWYGKSGWRTERIRVFSKIVRNTTDRGFIDFIKGGTFTGMQMEILLEFHKKGVPLAKLAELMGKDMTPDALRGALSAIQDGMLAAENGPAWDSGTEFAGLREQIKELAENIMKNQKFYESVSEQLKKIGDAREDADGVRAELSAEIDQRDRMLTDQQNELNNKVRDNAKLRAEKEQLVAEVESLKEKEGLSEKYEAEAGQLRKEKEELSGKIDSLRDENSALASQLAEVNEELSQKKAELEKTKAENIHINGELERLREKETAPEDMQKNNMQSDVPEDSPGAKGKEAERTGRIGNVDTGDMGDIPSGKVPYLSGSEQGTADNSEQGIMEDYRTVIRTGGREIPVTVEHTSLARHDGILSALGKKLFGDKSRMRIIKAAAAAKLDRGQMEQVKNAVRAGLLENEVIDIINSGFDAEEMEQAVEIVLAEKSY